MIFYFSLLFFCMILYPLLTRSLRSNNASRLIRRVNYESNEKLYFTIIALTLSIIIGMRSNDVGIDTSAYYGHYLTISPLPFKRVSDFDYFEPGFTVLLMICGRLRMSFQVFLILQGTAYIVAVTMLIRKYSATPWYSYFVFIAYAYFTFAFSAIRQSIAITIIIFAFLLALKKKPFWFFSLVLIAFSIHQSAIVFLPVYFIMKIRMTKATLWFLSGAAVAGHIFKGPVQLLISNIMRNDYSNESSPGWLLYIFFLGSCAIGILFCDLHKGKNQELVPFFYQTAIACILYPIFQANSVTMRLYLYFAVFSIIYIPGLIRSLKDKTGRVIGYLGYSATGIYFMFRNIFPEGLKLIPYLFFW